MRKNKINDIAIFVEVAKTGGFRAAARGLDLQPSSISQAIKRLEDELETNLLKRTTRSTALTEAGELLYRTCLPAIDEIERASLGIRHHKNLKHKIKISATQSSSSLFIDNLISQYSLKYPNVDIEIIYEDNKIDLINSDFDLAIRSKSLLDDGTFAVSVGPKLKMSLVAAPLYIEKHGKPRSPKDLINHQCLCFKITSTNTLAPWTFTSEEGQYTVTPQSKVIVNNIESILSYALSGLGVAYVFTSMIKNHVKKGRLVSFFEKEIVEIPQFSINYVNKTNMPEHIRDFIDMTKS